VSEHVRLECVGNVFCMVYVEHVLCRKYQSKVKYTLLFSTLSKTCKVHNPIDNLNNTNDKAHRGRYQYKTRKAQKLTT
jgi:hypothetical protein